MLNVFIIIADYIQQDNGSIVDKKQRCGLNAPMPARAIDSFHLPVRALCMCMSTFS